MPIESSSVLHPERCGAVGELTVAGRVVGLVRCSLDPGHLDPVPIFDELTDEVVGHTSGSPHAYTLEWGNVEVPVETLHRDIPSAPVPGRVTLVTTDLAAVLAEQATDSWRRVPAPLHLRAHRDRDADRHRANVEPGPA